MMEIEITSTTATGSSTRVERMDRDAVLVGRTSGCDLVLPAGNVASRHLALWVVDGLTWAQALPGSSSTFLAGKPLGTLPRRIHASDGIHLGNFRLRVLSAAPHPPQPQPLAGDVHVVACANVLTATRPVRHVECHAQGWWFSCGMSHHSVDGPAAVVPFARLLELDPSLDAVREIFPSGILVRTGPQDAWTRAEPSA